MKLEKKGLNFMKKVKTFEPYQRSTKWNGTKYIKFKLVVKPGFKPFGPLG